MPNCAFASEQEVLAQYSGSTTASYDYKPDCTFTIKNSQYMAVLFIDIMC